MPITQGTNDNTRNGSAIKHRCRYYVAWCPKYCRPVLVEPVAARLRAIIGEVIAGANAVLVDLAIEPDRVEMKVEVEPRLGIHRLVKRIKATSAGSLRNEFPRLRSRLPTLWNNNYYVSTIGRPERAAALRFLEEQREV